MLEKSPVEGPGLARDELAKAPLATGDGEERTAQ